MYSLHHIKAILEVAIETQKDTDDCKDDYYVDAQKTAVCLTYDFLT